MPLWPSLYFLANFVFATFVVREHLRSKINPWLIASSTLGEACLASVALGYWISSFSLIHKRIALLLFSLGVASLIVEGVNAFRDVFEEQEDSLIVRTGIVGFGTVLLALVFGPMLYWGFCFAILGKQSGA
jgi:hypothetical protein